MKTALKTILLLSAITLLSLVAWQDTRSEPAAAARLLATTSYQTSSTRTSTLGKVCTAGTSRTSLVSQTDISTSTSYRSTVNAAIGIDGNILFNKLTNSKMSDAMTMITSNLTGLLIFMLSFAFGLIIFLWIWPFLCCCCCCPGCCPSKCCRKAEDEQYSKCELYWPMVTLVLALLLTIAASSYGFANCSDIGPMFNNMACSVAIFTDDLLNGNVTLDGSSFFVGLNQFNTQMTTLGNNLANLQGNFSSLTNASMTASITTLTNTLTDIQNIPTGAGGAISLSYSSLINASPAAPTDISTFNTILGTSTTSGSLIYTLYQAVLGIKTFVTGVQTSSTNFNTQIPTIDSNINSTKNSIIGIIDSVTSADNNLGSLLSSFNTPGQYGSMGMQIFYGVLIGFSCLALLGALLTVCCDKYGCRYLMYFSCLIFFLGAFIGFFISTLFSFFVPVFTWTCSYLDYTLLSQANFKENFGTLFGSTTTSQISVCMPFGDGNIVNQVAGNAAAGLNNLTSVISGLGNFSASSNVNNLNSIMTPVFDTISAYSKGQISDLSITNDFDVLKTISDPSQYSGCTDPNFVADSWVPSISQWTNYTYVSCKATNGNTGTATSCGANIQTASPTCSGCMDATLLMTLYVSEITLGNDLLLRYPTTSCATFITDMKNVWTNYYSVKNPVLGPTATAASANVLGRTLAVKAKIIDNATSSGVYYGLYQIQSVFNSITLNLNAISDLTDSKYGMLAGLNCKVFGQDFKTLENVICGSFYKNIYLLRLTIGIASYGMLFAMCCIVCTGVRHYKHNERKGKVGDAFHNQEMDSKGDLRNTKS